MKFNLNDVFMTVKAGFYSSCATRQVLLLAKRD